MKEEMTTIQVILGEWMTCMNQRMTTVAFVTAMAMATAVFIVPRSMRETQTVRPVRIIRMKKTTK
jgi:hypothetical protein